MKAARPPVRPSIRPTLKVENDILDGHEFVAEKASYADTDTFGVPGYRGTVP